MPKVFIAPRFLHPDKADGGIRRIIDAQIKHLPDYGWKVVDNEKEADLINVRATLLPGRNDIPVVSSTDGAYWKRYEWGNWEWVGDVNLQVRENLRRGDAHTAPSIWVGDAMRRGMMIYPEVVYHGVDADEFQPGKEMGDFVLWNKARPDAVCDPADMNNVAKLLTSRKFLSTLGDPTSNVKISGVMPYDEMKKLVQGCGVYLSTARETFGIGTLEAMACGIPIAGWDWGGQSEIVVNGETGYLARPGDFKGLADAIERCFVEQKRLGENARQDVLKRWLWPDKIAQYADLFERTLNEYQAMKPKVSVIVTAYNLARYLPDTLNSLSRQSMKDWECIIVDDCSSDDTADVAKTFKKDKRFKYFKTPSNFGLCGARNFGVKKSTGKYVIMLDADDWLADNALSVMSTELDKDAGIHIAYGHLDMVNDKGEDQRRGTWPFKQFEWGGQMAHYNQLPYSAMMRRRVFDACGGYRQRETLAEDAAFWCMATSFGFVAKKVTEASMLIYRVRGDSKSHTQGGDGDWTASFGWATAHKVNEISYEEAVSCKTIPVDVVPFGAQGTPPRRVRAWPVHDRSYPKISVVIPVGPDHGRMVIDALDSLLSQSYQEWEAIVVNDTGKHWEPGLGSPVQGAPYAKVFETQGSQGPGIARNMGAKHAKGEVLLFLDADDYLLPKAMEWMWDAYKDAGGGVIIYGDWLKDDQDGKTPTLHEANNFECGAVLKQLQHSVTALVPREVHEKIGGFDESIQGWEDWDYYIACQTTGICSRRVAAPLFVYRFRAGKRREDSFAEKPNLLQYIHDKWNAYYSGEKTMTCRSCPGGARTPTRVRASSTASPALVAAVTQSNMVLLVYNGPHHGPVTYKGPITRTPYRFGKGESNRERYVYASDAEAFLNISVGGQPLFKVKKE